MLPALLLVASALLLPTATAQPVCTPTDSRLAELSGLGVRDGRVLAVSDGGESLRVLQLDPTSCAVVGELAAADDPRDVEDLAVAADGTVWLADTGDNTRSRDTVALFALRSDGRAGLHRLRYPDGPHDAEALLLERGGRPVVVTKEASGTAGVYTTEVGVDRLAQPGPTELQRVGELRIAATDTPGGPVGPLGSVLVTGGAVSPDGTVAAVRTYTDAYLFAAPDGDVVSALTRAPVRVPLPDEPQGEAVSFTAAGALLVGSEADGTTLPPLQQVAGATALAQQAPSPTPSPGSTASADGSGIETWQAALIAVLAAGAVVWLLGKIARLSRRR